MLPPIPKGTSSRKQQKKKIILLTETLSFACLNTLEAWVDSPPVAVKKKEDKNNPKLSGLTTTQMNFSVSFGYSIVSTE